jgi:hypothetical protein
MKIRKMLATMAVAGALFVCADAQAADVVIKKVEVPFDFTVRGYAMPAGTYTIFRTDPAQDLFILRNIQTRDNVVTLAHREGTGSYDSKLVFANVDGRPVLTSIVTPTSQLTVTTIKAERRLAMRTPDSVGGR